MNQASSRRSTALALTLLTAGVCAAWIPLLGGCQLVADEFPWNKIIREEGISGYLRRVGFWRPLGVWLPVRLYQWHSWMGPALSLGTHLISVLMFFAVLRAMFGGRRLPVLVALIFGMFPFCYEAQTWMLAANYEMLLPQFLAILLILLSDDGSPRFVGLRTSLLFGLALSANLTNESLFFSIALCGSIALWKKAWLGSRIDVRTFVFVLAPAAGSFVWFLLQHFFVGPEMPKKIGFHPASLFSPHLRQEALLDIFVPWSSPVARGLLGASWQASTTILAWGNISLFIAAGVVFSFGGKWSSDLEARKKPPFLLLLLLLLGTSLIYVLAGGFSLDSRKRYELLPIWLMSVAWVYRAVAGKYKVAQVAGLCSMLLIGAVGCSSTWLVIDIWRHEVARYNALAQFLADQKISGNIRVQWDPDLYRAWPQFGRSLGFRFDDDWVLNLALDARGAAHVHVTNDPADQRLVDDPIGNNWTLAH